MPIVGSLGSLKAGLYGRSSFWNTAPSPSVARLGLAGAGTQTAALIFGGYAGPGQYDYTASTEAFNGTSWSSGGSLGTGSVIAGCGTQTAALGFGGNTDGSNATLYLTRATKYNGTSWSLTGSLNAPIQAHTGFGTQDAAVSTGGNRNDYVEGYPVARSHSELFNGSTWSITGSLLTARVYPGSCGTSTSGLLSGGFIYPFCGNAPCPYTVFSTSEYFNGSTWSSAPSLLAPRWGHGSAGSQTLAVVFGGANYPDNITISRLATTEEFNGISWSSRRSMPGALNRGGGLGVMKAAMFSCGQNSAGTIVTTTYRYFS